MVFAIRSIIRNPLQIVHASIFVLIGKRKFRIIFRHRVVYQVEHARRMIQQLRHIDFALIRDINTQDLI